MMSVARYRLDELRRFAADLLGSAGLASARASALAAHLLWHDAAGLPRFGFGTLADWLERARAREFDPGAEGKVTGEMTGTAVFDGAHGAPPLALARAGALAVEKARDAGIGLVRVLHVGPAAPVAAIASELAIGPYVGLVLGHDGSWAVALPAPEGLPAVFDAAFTDPAHAPQAEHPVPWAMALIPDQGWLVGAVAVGALEPLGTFHERVDEWRKGRSELAAGLLPASWEAHRRTARERGVEVSPAVWEGLRLWAERAHTPLPELSTGPVSPH